ncbi:hypothetical protein [Paraburkholderia xenovorans]|uniref:hypothetical protein n=1 Tax=Paraburkholderia xenovorans TaxID=36873 RepID=UPI00030EDE69|nr:hypothetical protein [Paraburkholderia xenovorans]
MPMHTVITRGRQSASRVLHDEPAKPRIAPIRNFFFLSMTRPFPQSNKPATLRFSQYLQTRRF